MIPPWMRSRPWAHHRGLGGTPSTTCLAALLALLAPACRELPTDHRPVVVVSVLPQAALVKALVGDAFAVEVMIPPGANPLTHEPTVGQLKALSRALLYVKVGHPHFPFEETWLDVLLAEASDRLTVVDGSRNVERLPEDPHVWLSPAALVTMAQDLAAALKCLSADEEAADVDHALAALLAEIAAVDTELRSLLGELDSRRFVVFHPAWGYFAEEYDLEQVALQHLHKPPSPLHIVETIEMARAAGLDVVFAQPHFSRDSLALVAEEIGARVETVDPLAYDWAAELLAFARSLSGAGGDA